MGNGSESLRSRSQCSEGILWKAVFWRNILALEAERKAGAKTFCSGPPTFCFRHVSHISDQFLINLIDSDGKCGNHLMQNISV